MKKHSQQQKGMKHINIWVLNNSQVQIIKNTIFNSKNRTIWKLQSQGNKYLSALAVMFSFGIVKWTQTDIENQNRLTRTSLTKHQDYHPRSSIERFHLHRRRGGRGLIDFTNVRHLRIQQLRTFFLPKSIDSPILQVIAEVDLKFTPLDLSVKIKDFRNHIVNKEHIDT